MLTERPTRHRVGQQQQSLRQEYSEFILERIEEFKDQLSRTELLALADEAVQELEVGPDGQLVLTEILVLEHVDRLIMRRLNLPTFRHWRDRHVRLRRAQRAPTHWGLDRHSPLVELAESFDGTGVALVVGSSAAAAGFFLAAHEWPVVFIDRQLSSVQAAETRAAAEGLTRWFQAYVVGLGDWFPDVEPALTILDPSTLTGLGHGARLRFLEQLQARTVPGGVHVVLPEQAARSSGARLVNFLRPRYGTWRVDDPGATPVPRWFLAMKP